MFGDIICDTREKKNRHVLDYFRAKDIPFVVRKLDTADYILEGSDALAIDRKQNLEELSRNLLNKKDHSRFWKELRRAHETGMRLVILCEHGEGIRSLPDVASWHSRFSPVDGRFLLDEMVRVEMAYGAVFRFCNPTDTGSEIAKILLSQTW